MGLDCCIHPPQEQRSPLAPMDEEASLTDLQAVRATRDELALARLYDRYAGRLYRVCVLILRDEALAQDALQDVFLQVWDRAASFDPSRGSLGGWLHVLARSRALDHLRRRKRQGLREASTEPELLERSMDVEAPNALEGAEQAQRRERVTTWLHALPPEQAEVLRLAYYRGLSQHEISRRLARPLGTVKAQMRRGLLRLAAMQGEELRQWL